MTRVRIDIDGAAERAAVLRTAGVRIERLAPPTRRAGEAVRDRAAALAPKRTGYLARSGKVAGAGSTAIVRFTARYAPYVEYGTSRMRRQPYLMPAAESSDSVIRRVYVDHVDAATRPAR